VAQVGFQQLMLQPALKVENGVDVDDVVMKYVLY
jgi:hypothetical protein